MMRPAVSRAASRYAASHRHVPSIIQRSFFVGVALERRRREESSDSSSSAFLATSRRPTDRRFLGRVGSPILVACRSLWWGAKPPTDDNNSGGTADVAAANADLSSSTTTSDSLSDGSMGLTSSTTSGGSLSGGSVADPFPSTASDQKETTFTAFDDHSTTPSVSSTSTTTEDSVEATLDKLFADSASSQQVLDAAASGTTEAAVQAATVQWEPTWYSLSDQAIAAVQSLHEFSGLEWGWSIVGATVILRLVLFPAMVTSRRTGSRMAHLNPELQQLKARYESLGATPSRADQIRFGKEMQALFRRYEVKPSRMVIAPLLQFPLFMGMFFGIRKMLDIFPEQLATGGMFWFPDLTMPDPYFILPVTTVASFLLMTEQGKEQMMSQDPARGQMMLNIFRIMSVSMFPVAVTFESALVVYWTANGFMSLVQMTLLNFKPAQRYLGIWEPPKPVPGQAQPDGLVDAAKKVVKAVRGQASTDAEQMKLHNQALETKRNASQMVRKRKRSSRMSRTRSR